MVSMGVEMASRLFQTITTGQTFLDRIQSNVQNAFNALIGNSQFLGGAFISNIGITSGDNVITHGLGKQPQIWVICDLNASATFYRTAWTSNTITLNSSADCTISLWVN